MPLLDQSSLIGFGFNPLNRLSEKRSDDAFVDGKRREASARFVVFVGEVPVFGVQRGGHDALFTYEQVLALGQPSSDIFLGQGDNRSGNAVDDTGDNPDQVPGLGQAALFAAYFDKDHAAPIAARADLDMVDLRSVALRGLVAPALLGELGCAKALLSWHQHHRYCANCGQPSSVSSAGWRRDCAACNSQHFPRVDPVVIMLATDGDRCLLGRSPRFATGMYSALAGFLEPGETIEDAVRREILEESGIACSQVAYFASQPWPFPSSLMIGCFAKALNNDITVDTTELDDARWFTRQEVANMLAGEHADGLSAPKPFAIAYHLLKAFVAGDVF
jgi:NAD+ diphosphatase